MTDYISREAVRDTMFLAYPLLQKDRLEDVINSIPAADAIEELIRDLDDMKEANIALYGALPKWIPVTERLPEYDRKVLAFVKNKDPNGRFNKDGIYTAVLRNKVPEHDPEGKKNFWGLPGYDSVWTVWSWSYFTEPDVLYWMPLPEPPKEE